MFPSISATEVLIDKIVEIPGIYPRFEVDEGRIELFYEHMQCGQEFPPINIVKDESNKGCYVLLGGKHRLEAWRRSGKRKIKAFRMAVERRHWRLVAASLNAMSSKPLKGEELKKVIRDAYEIDGIRDTEEIAHKLNCTVQYVRKILKPVRDMDKEKLKERVVQLRKEGLSLSDISNKTGKPRPTIQSILKAEVYENETVSFSYTPKSEENSSNSEKTLPNPCTITAESGKSKENGFFDETAEKEKLKEQVVQLRKEGLSEREIAAKTDKPQPTVHRIITDVIQNETCFEMNHPETGRIPANSEKTPPNPCTITAESEKSDENGFSDKTADNNCFPKEPRSVIPDLEKHVHSWTPADKQAIRAMELAGAGWNVEQIAKRLDRTEQFVRNVAAAVVAFFQNQSPKHPLANRSHQEIAEALSMEPVVAEFMGDIVICSPGIISERKNIWWWLRENFPKYRSGAVERGSLIDIIRHETVYWKAVADNVRPSWEQEKEQLEPLEKFPEDKEKRFLDYINLIDELIDMSNKGTLKKIAQAVLQRCNMVVIEQNKLRRKLGQWNVPAEDNNNYESAG